MGSGGGLVYGFCCGCDYGLRCGFCRGFRCHFLRVLVARARFALGIDISRFRQRDLRQHRSDQLVNEHRKQRYVRDQKSVRAQRLLRFERHTERYARLRQQRYAEVFDDVIVTARKLGAEHRARILARRTAYNIRYADEYVHTVCEYGKL